MEKLFQLVNGIYLLLKGLFSDLFQTLKVRQLSKEATLPHAGYLCRHVCFVEKDSHFQTFISFVRKLVFKDPAL